MENDNFNELEQKLYAENIIYQWEYTGPFGGKNAVAFRWIFSFLGAYTIPVILFFLTQSSIGDLGFWSFLGLGTLMFFVARFLFMPDNHYHYHLTQKGIHYTQEQVIPEGAYKFVRGFAWFGIAVCIVAVVFIGPMAFVGAGAFAFMSFGLTNFSSKVDKLEVIFSSSTVLFKASNDALFTIKSLEESDLAYFGEFYAQSIDDMNETIIHISQILMNIEIIEVKKYNDRFKHPLYSKALQDS